MNGEAKEKIGITRKNMRLVSKKILLAKKMGKSLGRSEILQ